MNMNRALTIFLAAVLLALLSGCRKKVDENASMYETLMGSNWGIGIELRMTPERAQEVLGEANFSVAGNSKITNDLIWIPVETDAHSLDDSQLRLTFTDGILTRILCKQRIPETESDVIFPPPFIVKVDSGASLGSLKTDFVNKLGTPTEDLTDSMIWDYTSEAGERLRITATFELDESINVATCRSITVQTGKPLAGSMAEDRKKEPTY